MASAQTGEAAHDTQLALSLREEIRLAQSARTDLMKWKLVAIGALGAAAFGVGTEGQSHFRLFLCVIPLLCGYIDLVCYHLDLKTQVIGEFLLAKGDAYEAHVSGRLRKFRLETGALLLSSVIVSLIVGALGFARGFAPERAWLVLSGAIGLATSLVVWLWFRSLSR